MLSEFISLFAATESQSVATLWSQWGIPASAFITVVCSLALLRRAWQARNQAAKNDEPDLMPVLEDPDTADDGAFGLLTPALASQLPESEKESRDFRLLLRQAGIYHPAARNTIYALRFLFLVTPLVIAGVCVNVADPEWTWPILGVGVLTAAVLSIIPRLYVFFRRKSRIHQIRAGLADTVDMLSMCISGGLNLSESLEHVAGQNRAYPALAEELRILKRQMEVGSLSLALADLNRRVDIPEIRQLSALLNRGTKLGTRLAGTLNEQADQLRKSLRLAATARANKTPVKLVFPIMFCLAPAALIVLTAPALLELRNFFVPAAQQPAGVRGITFGTNNVINALNDLDQRVEVGLPTGRAAPELPY
ncbi:MAG: hypothetical protein Kow0040_24690 [Thermogutta sp.]